MMVRHIELLYQSGPTLFLDLVSERTDSGANKGESWEDEFGGHYECYFMQQRKIWKPKWLASGIGERIAKTVEDVCG